MPTLDDVKRGGVILAGYSPDGRSHFDVPRRNAAMWFFSERPAEADSLTAFRGNAATVIHQVERALGVRNAHGATDSMIGGQVLSALAEALSRDGETDLATQVRSGHLPEAAWAWALALAFHNGRKGGVALPPNTVLPRLCRPAGPGCPDLGPTTNAVEFWRWVADPRQAQVQTLRLGDAGPEGAPPAPNGGQGGQQNAPPNPNVTVTTQPDTRLASAVGELSGSTLLAGFLIASVVGVGFLAYQENQKRRARFGRG